MQNLSMPATEFTPGIEFDCRKHTLNMKGNSYLEDPVEFYTPVFAWLQDYLAQLNQDTEVLVNTEIAYFNSSSGKMLLNFFHALNEKAFQDAIPVDVNWYYDPEDPDMLEYGEDFQADFQALRFQYHEQEYDGPLLR